MKSRSKHQHEITNENKQGTLFVVSVPIGNLGDITLRAIETLKSVDLILCEDTRKSRTLFEKYEIKSHFQSLHKFSENQRTSMVLEMLAQDLHVALITDAGTPAISDPGTILVAKTSASGFKVIPIPGPSSITAALSVSGFDGSQFQYLGFVPRSEKDKVAFMEEIKRAKCTTVFFESPHRLAATLKKAGEVLIDRKLVLCREMTKMFEEVIRGTVPEITQKVESMQSIKGEITIVVEAAPREEVSLEAAEEILKAMIQNGISGKQLLDKAKEMGIKRNQAYKILLTHKPSE